MSRLQSGLNLGRFFIALAFFAPAPIAAWADTVTTTGALSVSADTRFDGTFGGLTVDPVFEEDVAGEWTTEIRLFAPADFVFDSSTPVVATVDVPGGGSTQLVLDPPTFENGDTEVAFNVNTVAAGDPARVTFSNIFIRPTTDAAATAGPAAPIEVQATGLPLHTLVDVTVTPGVAVDLGIDTVASPQTAGVGFNVTVRSFDAVGNEAPVVGATDVRLYVDSGVGGLMGTRDGQILAATSSVVIGPVAYDTVENNVTLLAIVTSGDALNDAFSNAFDVALNPADVDLEAVALGYDSILQSATLSYVVTTPAPPTGAYNIEFFLDRNGDNAFNFADDGPAVDSAAGDTSVGAHVLAGDFSAEPAAAMQRVFAVIDRADAVVEGDETNNTAETVNSAGADIIAISLAYDSVSQSALLSYSVDSPIAISPYNIEFFLDRNGDNAFNFADDGPAVDSAAGDTSVGAHVLAGDFSAEPAAAMQRVFAVIDRADVFPEDDETNNEAQATNSATSDIEAVSVSYDSNTTLASLTYSVQSPTPLAAYDIEFFLDRNGDGTFNFADDGPAVDTVAGQTADGSYVVAGDFSAEPAATGQVLFAVIDRADAVAESDEGNNQAQVTNSATTDIEAVGVSYDSNTTSAVLSYNVISPVPVGAYTIEFFLDRNGDSTFNFADDGPAVDSVAGMTAPGAHTASGDFSGEPAATGQIIFAVIDRADAVAESDETNNEAQDTNNAATDISVATLAYDSVTQSAALGYDVQAPVPVGAYDIEFFLDRNGDGTFNFADDGPAVDTVAGQSADGSYSASGDFSAEPAASGQVVFAVIDRADAVSEADEGNNLAQTTNTAPTDIEAVNVAYDSNTQFATLSYNVITPTAVGAYDIEFFLDRNNDTVFNFADDGPAVDTVSGQTTDGSYIASGDFTAEPAATGQVIFAVIDRADAVSEADEGNNQVQDTNTAATDLIAVSLAYDSVAQSATFGYTVQAPVPVGAYNIEFFLDRNGDNAFNFADDGPAVDTVAGQTVDGDDNVSGDFSGEPAGSGQVVFAVIDRANAVAEADEGNNQQQATNAATTDIIAIGVTYDSNLTQATLTYNVASPVPVGAYNIEFFLDRNGNNAFNFADDGPAVDTVAGQTTPGGTSALGDFSGEPAGTGQRIFAVIDRADAVAEDDDVGNNIVDTVNTAVTDIIASALAVDAGTAVASLTYSVVSPVAVAAYEIRFSLLDAGNNVKAANLATISGETSAGTHNIDVDLRAALDAIGVDHGDYVRAEFDINNTVAEDNEGNNQRDSAGMFVDVVADDIDVADVGAFSFQYQVTSPANVPAFDVRIWLDRGGDGSLDTLLATLAGDVAPGVHSATPDLQATLDALRVEDGDRIVGVVDPADLNTVGEANEDLDAANVNASNNGLPARAFDVDVRIDSIIVNPSNAYDVTVTYTVVAPANVPDFSIELGLNGPGNDLGAAAGNVAPGTHTATFQIADALIAGGVLAGQAPQLFASAVQSAAFAEMDLANNEQSETTSYTVDLGMEGLTFGGTDLDVPFDVTVSYLVATNRPSTDFAIAIYASLDDTLDAGDRLLRRVTVSGPATTLGLNTLDMTGLIVERSGPFQTADFSLIVRLDDLAQIDESSESNNLLNRANAVADAENVDVDGDGLTRREEQIDGTGVTNIDRADRTVQQNQTDPPEQVTTSDDDRDSDNDGLDDRLERITGTNPDDADTDRDGLADGVEDANRNGVLDPGETDPRDWDTDGDQLSDAEEQKGFLITRYAAGSNTGRFAESAIVTTVTTDPRNPDTDGDGISDWNEINTWARFAFINEDANGNGVLDEGEDFTRNGRLDTEMSVVTRSIGLDDIIARRGAVVSKPVWGVRTDPTMADTDEDGIDDTTDPAPQINPARWGFDTNGDDVFDETDLATLRSELEAAGGDTSDFPTTVVEFQRRLMDFDQDNDGFLEAPDSNGDGFPDFTRYNEATLEQAFGIDFSNDGTLEDGFDVGGLGLGPAGPNDSRAESATRDQTLFGTFRIARDASGLISGDGWVDLVDSIGVLIPSDNCPTSSNPNQLDFDGDGLGDTCDADLDNDGVPNALDPVEQNPTAQTAPIAPLCGFGMLQGLIGCLIGMSGMRRVTRRRR